MRNACLVPFVLAALHGPMARVYASHVSPSCLVREHEVQEPQEEKAPVPGEAVLGQARARVRNLLPDKFAKAAGNSSRQRELAQELLEMSEGLGDEPVDRYAVLVEALELAVEGRDCRTGLSVVEKVCAWFAAVNGETLRQELILGIGPRMLPEETPLVASVGLELLDACLIREDADRATQLYEAIRLKTMRHGAEELKKRLEAAKVALDGLKEYLTAVEALEKDPRDPKANRIVGWRLAFVVGELERGLKCLAQSPDGPLKQCAELDVADPTEPSAQIKAGDAWSDWAKARTDHAREVAKERAIFWYEQAHPRLTGVERQVLEKKLEALRAVEAAAIASSRKPAPSADSELGDPVGLGLDWLAAHQSPQGSWDCDGFTQNCDKLGSSSCGGVGMQENDVGVTGLALLAFVRAGETRDLKKYANTLATGLQWLVRQQDGEGCFGPRVAQHFIYNHACAALAVVEALGIPEGKDFKKSAQDGINFVLSAQNPYGAWRYSVPPTGDNDTSVTGWMVQVLRAGKLSSLAFDAQAITNAAAFIDEVTDPATGRTGYAGFGELPSRMPHLMASFPSEMSESLTAVGMLVRLSEGRTAKKDPMIGKGADLLVKKLPEWNEDGRIDFYYWYYGTLALHEVGGPRRDKWNKALRTALADNQCRKEGEDDYGSWDPVDPWSPFGGRVYATALNCLSMQVD